MNQPNNNIINELRELSPAVAEVPRVNVFKVPQGYFETLPALLLLQTGDLTNHSNNHTVPQGYFDNLAADIMSRIKNEASQENEHSNVLAGIGNKNVFTVPSGYFEGVASNIVAQIHNENNSEVFAETNAISETIARIGNKNVLTVPAGYFNDLANNINSKIDQPAKVVPMNSFRKFYKYAAAAVIMGFIALTTVFIINNNKGGADAAVSMAAMKEAKSIIQTNSFDKEMASLSDADIVNFLESKGQDVNAALVASLSEDTKALPEAEDYLLDENTLDDVLKKLDLNN